MPTASSKGGPSLDDWSGVHDKEVKAGWFGDRAARRMPSVKADRPRWRTWISPVLGPKPMADITREDIESFVASLDDDVREGELSWKTAVNVWTLLRRAFGDAAAGKVPALRVRKDNPTEGVRGPDRGVKRAKTFLYPTEALQFFACQEVSPELRVAAALALYSGLRVAELRALRWLDVNLVQKTIHVHRSMSRDGTVKPTKTKTARLVPIEPALFDLLVAMHREAGGKGQVITYYLDHNLSSSLRDALRRSGVLRPELHVDGGDRTRVAIRWHDLRGSFCTWCAARGEDVLRVMARAGHEDIKTTEGYVALGGLLSTSIGEVFPRLPLEAMGLRIEAPRLRIEEDTEATTVADAVGEEAVAVDRLVLTPVPVALSARKARTGGASLTLVGPLARAPKAPSSFGPNGPPIGPNRAQVLERIVRREGLEPSRE